MDDDVVSQFCRQEHDLVIEIQIAFCRTAPPSRALITDTYLADLVIIKIIEMLQPRASLLARGFLVLLEIFHRKMRQ